MFRAAVNRRTGVGAVLACALGATLSAAASETAAEQSWQARASAPGVVYANNFSTRARAEDGILRDRKADQVVWDRRIKASGGGSIRFEIAVGDPPNSGNWRTNFAAREDGYGVKFGANQPFYIQVRLRRSENLAGAVFPLRSGGRGGRKILIIGEGDYAGAAGEVGSCTTLHLVTQDTNQRGLFQSYHSCGRYQPYQDRFRSQCDRSDWRLQTGLDRGPQGFSGCEEDRRRYSLRSQNKTGQGTPPPDDGSVRLRSGQWQTLLIKVSPGPLGSGAGPYLREAAGFIESRYELWVADEGEGYVKVTDVSGIVLRRHDGDRDTDEKYGKVWFTPFHTHQDPRGRWPIPDSAYVWYDELIVSTQPINDPAGGPVPP